jgi:CHASE2 domain-containing sensor protein
MEPKAGDTATMQRIACALIGAALFVICCLVALLLGDALSPGRVAPMLAFYTACGAGVSLVLGLAMLERRGAPHGAAGTSEGP